MWVVCGKILIRRMQIIWHGSELNGSDLVEGRQVWCEMRSRQVSVIGCQEKRGQWAIAQLFYLGWGYSTRINQTLKVGFVAIQSF